MIDADKHIILCSEHPTFQCEDAAKVLLSIPESYRESIRQIVIRRYRLDLFFRDEESLNSFRTDCASGRFKIIQHLQPNSVVSFMSYNANWYSIYAKFSGGDELVVGLFINDESCEDAK